MDSSTKCFLRGCFPNIHLLLWPFLSFPTTYFQLPNGQLQVGYFVPSNSTWTKQILILFLSHPLTVFLPVSATSIIPGSQTTSIGVIFVSSVLAPVALFLVTMNSFFHASLDSPPKPHPFTHFSHHHYPLLDSITYLDHTNSRLTLSLVPAPFNIPIIFNLSFLKDFSRATLQAI